MNITYADGEVKTFGYKYGCIPWTISSGEYCLLDWVGLPGEAPFSKIFKGLITRPQYIKYTTSLKLLTPEKFPDSLLLTKNQTLNFIRWPRDPVVDNLISGDKIGWIPTTSGIYENQLSNVGKRFLQQIRNNSNIALEASQNGVSAEMEFIAYLLMCIPEQDNMVTALINLYEDKLELFVKEIRAAIINNDFHIRKKYRNEINQNIYSNFNSANINNLPLEYKYVIGNSHHIFNQDQLNLVLKDNMQPLIEALFEHFYSLIF